MTTLESSLASLITSLGTDYKALVGQGYKGAWSAGLYKKGSVVRYNGVIYAAPADTSNAPIYPTTNYSEAFGTLPSGSYWAYSGSTASVDTGSLYGSNTLTPANCMVLHAVGGALYVQVTLTFPSGGTFAFVDNVGNRYGLLDWDNQQFFIDGVLQYNTTGLSFNWTQRSFSVGAGTHTFKWLLPAASSDGRYYWAIGNIVANGSVISGDWDVIGYQSDIRDISTTKGDILVRGASDWIRVPVGSDDQTIFADSAQTSGLAWRGITDSDIAPVSEDTQTASFTFVLADKHRAKVINSASATIATIPPNSSVAYPLWTVLTLYNKSTGQSTWTGGAGVTLRTPHGAKTNGQYTISTATQVATDEWVISGDTTT